MTGEIVFDILAIDSASRTFSKVALSAGAASDKIDAAGARMSRGFLVAGAVAAGLGIEAVKMAGNFDAAVVRLTTTAGESQSALTMVSNGLLDMAGKVGYTAQELAVGMYTVESAGFHGAEGLRVMAASAKAARVEGADLSVVTNAVTSLLVDYHLKADDAARVTNILTAAVGHGKTTFQGMAAALPNVAAAAASAHIHMDELASAIATMTMHGTDAGKAGTYLRQVIGQLEAPTSKARLVMRGLGIDANKLGLVLSSNSGSGLADAIRIVDEAIQKHLTPSGLVAIDQFRKSKDATTAYQKVLANLPPAFVTTFGALSNMVGGVKSLQGFLQLGGKNLHVYEANVKAVRTQVRLGGGDVAGFAQQQGTLNGKLADAKGALSAFAIEIGHHLEPVVGAVTTTFEKFTLAMQKHSRLATGILVGLSAIAAGLLAIKAAAALAAIATAALGGEEVVMALGMGLAAIATEGLSAAFATLDLVMEANPFGLILLAIEVVVVAFVVAYKKIGWFRDGVNAVFHAVGAAAQWIGRVIGPAFRVFVDVAKWVLLVYTAISELSIEVGIWAISVVAKTKWFREAASASFHAVVVAIKAIGSAAQATGNFLKSIWPDIVHGFLAAVGAIVHAAASAFGWVPGVGKQLRNSAAQFDSWRASVTASIDGVPSNKTTIFTILQRVVHEALSVPASIAAPKMNLFGVQTGGATTTITSAPQHHPHVAIPNADAGAAAGAALGGGLAKGITKGQSLLTQALDKMTGYITNKTSQITALLNARNSVVQSFQAMTSSVFSQDFTQGGTVTTSTSALIAFQQQQLAAAVQLQADITKVVSLGLSKSLTAQYAASGATGAANLHALATGPASAISQLNALNAQTTAALTAAGGVAGNSLYGSQIQAAQRDRNTAVAIRNELEKWRRQHDKNTVIELHIGGKVIRTTLLELKRNLGGKALGLS